MKVQSILLFSVFCNFAVSCGRNHQSFTQSLNDTSVKLIDEFDDYSMSIAYANNKIFATNVYDKKVWIYDTATQKLITKIETGRAPFRLTTNDKFVYVVNQYAQDLGDTYVGEIDTRSLRLARTMGVSEKLEGNDPNNYPTTGFPQDITIMDGTLYVVFPTNPQPNIMPISLGNWAENKMVPAGSGPFKLTGVNGTLVVVNERAMGDPRDERVLEIDKSGRVVKTHEMPGYLGMIITANGKAWISRTTVDRNEGMVMIIDPSTHEVRSIRVGIGASGMALQGDKLYVVCQDKQMIAVIDTNTEKVIDSFEVATTQPEIKYPRTIAVTPNGDIYVRSLEVNGGGLPHSSLYLVKH